MSLGFGRQRRPLGAQSVRPPAWKRLCLPSPHTLPDHHHHHNCLPQHAARHPCGCFRACRRPWLGWMEPVHASPHCQAVASRPPHARAGATEAHGAGRCTGYKPSSPGCWARPRPDSGRPSPSVGLLTHGTIVSHSWPQPRARLFRGFKAAGVQNGRMRPACSMQAAVTHGAFDYSQARKRQSQIHQGKTIMNHMRSNQCLWEIPATG